MSEKDWTAKQLITVVIPVYNAQKFLDTCIESIVRQTHAALEIILIDDGSIDASPMLCDAWANKDKRIRVLHKKNEGVSRARNTGLQLAQGSYISFVDADDYIDCDMLEAMLNIAIEEDADIVECGVNEIMDDITTKTDIQKYHTMDHIEVIKHLLLMDGIVQSVVWNKLFKRSAISSICFDETFRYGEDTIFLYNVLKQHIIYRFLKAHKYNYIRRETSLVGTSFHPLHMSSLHAGELIKRDCDSLFKELHDITDCHIAMCCFSLLMQRGIASHPASVQLLREHMQSISSSLIWRNYDHMLACKWMLCKYFPGLITRIRA